MELKDIKGVGPSTCGKLSQLGLASFLDVLNFLPVKYLDLSHITSPEELKEGDFAIIECEIEKIEGIRRIGKTNFFRAKAKAGGVELIFTWFNAPYLRNNLSQKRYFAVGKLKSYHNGFEMIQPKLYDETKKPPLGILPFYRTKGIVSQEKMRAIVGECLKSEQCLTSPVDVVAGSLWQACRKAHQPQTMAEAEEGSRRMILENFVLEICAYKLLKKPDKLRQNRYFDFNLSSFKQGLGFDLTESQEKAVNDIICDFQSERVMNRMLTGDVGSGKTAVAFAAVYLAVKNGYQAAMLAPSSILAQQHYRNAQKILQPLSVKIALLTAQTDCELLRRQIESGDIDFVIGTHSLIGSDISFNKLALAITDEQHRFGVQQKNKLAEKGECDTLVMSATPLPRSIMLSMHGDINTSCLTRRTPLSELVTTYLMGSDKVEKLIEYIAKKESLGEKCFMVFAAIEDNEGFLLNGAENFYNKNKNRFQNAFLLHGGMSDEEKSEVVNAFCDSQGGVLVATSIVEVGIDIADCTVMAVINAERFGLAGLHQLRGRVGRNNTKAECFFHYSGRGDLERLKILPKETDGYKIAEADFALRGGGDFIGLRQSGVHVDGAFYSYASEVADQLLREANIQEDERILQKMEQVESVILS